MRSRPLTALTLALALAALCALALPGVGAAAGSPTATAAKKGKKAKRSRRDLDGDGIKNKRDKDVDGDRVPNRRDRDIDGDRKKNKRDREMDGDGVKNAKDKDIDADRKRNCPRDKDMDADRKRNTRDRDMDGDGKKNGQDRDIDADGVPNKRDRDMDCDGLGKRVDKDIDGDGIPNYKDPDSDASGSKEDGSLPTNVHLPRAFFGIVADNVGSSSGGARASNLTRLGDLNVGTIRQKFEWSRIERAPGVYDYRFYDQYVADVTSRGYSILPVLFDPPAWRSARPVGGGGRGTYPPRSNAEFAQFASRLVKRYGPNGTFWKARPWLAHRPLRAWQVWNEPHIKAYWPSGQDPSEYVGMLRAVGGAIKGADRGAEVVAAGLSETNIGIPVDQYLKGMYQAGGRATFDTVAVHPYAAAADQSYDIMNRVRQVMDSHGDGAKPMRVTELGWATWGNNPNPFNVGAEGQSELVRRVWATLVKKRDRLKLRGLIYYNWRDIPPHAPDFQDYFGLHVGLLDISGRPKPAYESFRATVRALT